MKGFGLPIILLISQLFIYRGKRNKQCIRNMIKWLKVARTLLWSRDNVTVSIGSTVEFQIHILEGNGLESKLSLLSGNTPQVIGGT